MEYRVLTREEIPKFKEIDRREVIDQLYYFRKGTLVLEDKHFDVPEWTEKHKNEVVSSISILYDRGGTVFGAFDDELLVGLSTVDVRFLGKNEDLLNLNGLWVSQGYRGKGIASKLVSLVEEIALGKGAKGLYVSSTESKNTVEFYMNQGFVLTSVLDPVLFKKEPKDIHLTLRF